MRHFSPPWRTITSALAALGVIAAVVQPVYADDGPYDPPAVYLTWQQDPTTTMTVQWHSSVDRPGSVIEYKPVGGEDWSSVTGASEPFFSLEDERLVHTAEITSLQPDTLYRFRWDEDSTSYKFRTMPEALDRPVRFAAGGDLQHRSPSNDSFARMNKQVAKFNIDFLVFGGDLAYADGDPRHRERWKRWFKTYKETFISPDGRLIPHLPGIGNHEIFEMRRLERDGLTELAEKWGLKDGEPHFYFNFFAFPGRPGYGVLDFGNYLSIILLDSDHYSDIEGEQTEWLADVLADRQDVTHVFPVYHVPAYPSVRAWDASTSRRLRSNWIRLFEQNNVYVAFENHEHAYKRTHPLLNDELHPEGIVYLGDGSWGRANREPGQFEGSVDWHLAEARQSYSAFVVTLYPDQFHALAIDNEGNVFDEYYRRLDQ